MAPFPLSRPDHALPDATHPDATHDGRRDGWPEPVAPVHRAEDLTGSGGLARITLRDQVYALRITRAGKLILTK